MLIHFIMEEADQHRKQIMDFIIKRVDQLIKIISRVIELVLSYKRDLVILMFSLYY